MLEGHLGGPTQLIDFDLLESHAGELRERFARAHPWPHVELDDFLVPHAAQAAMSAFPPFGTAKTVLARLLEARSYGVNEGSAPIFDAIASELHGRRFVAWLESLTGIGALAPDIRLVGAGFHQGARGSYLRVHADHNTHPQDGKRFRRLSLLLYLNEEWQPDWNGALELWDDRALACGKKIEPILNRCVIMETGDRNYHGYGPLRSPDGTTRKAFAAYYYSPEPGAAQVREPHDTLWPEQRTETTLTRLNHTVRRTLLWHFERTFRSRKPKL